MIGGLPVWKISSKTRELGRKPQNERDPEKHCDVTHSPALWASERSLSRERRKETS